MPGFSERHRWMENTNPREARGQEGPATSGHERREASWTSHALRTRAGAGTRRAPNRTRGGATSARCPNPRSCTGRRRGRSRPYDLRERSRGRCPTSRLPRARDHRSDRLPIRRRAPEMKSSGSMLSVARGSRRRAAAIGIAVALPPQVPRAPSSVADREAIRVGR